MAKIIFLLPNLTAGGAERVAINYLRQLDLSKYEVSLIVFEKTDDLLALVPAGVALIDLKTKASYRSFWALLKGLYQLRPDIVFTTHSRVAALLMLVKPFAPKFRHLARMQSTPSLEKKHMAYGVIRRKLYALGFQGADIVIAQTEAMKNDGETSFSLKSDRVKVLSNPIDNGFIDKSLKGVVIPFPDDKITAVASGRLAHEKGFDLLIKALPKIIKKYPNFVLYILGRDAEERENLKLLVEKLGLENSVSFIGYQKNPYPYYFFCNVFILSSRWEGLPNAMLENYYLNTPIVATKCVPIVSELIQDGVNGIRCEIDDPDCLVEAVVQCVARVKRENIKNPEYSGSKLEVLF